MTLPRILVGTASWTDPSLIRSGRFYPKGADAEARLRFYASRFPLVEVDSSWYALPSERNARLWVERTPVDFEFNVKAFRLFTGHQTPAQALPRDLAAALDGHFRTRRNLYYKDAPGEIRDELWARFVRGITPMREAGRLGVVHFQFAPWVRPVPAAFAHLDECAARLPGWRLATEFRHRDWFDAAHREQTLANERGHGFVHVVVDAPQGPANSVPQVWEVTDPALAIVRLHGRNLQTWNAKGLEASADRFNYDYSDAELAGLAHSIRRLAMGAGKVHVIFNNNYEDQGQRNAASLQALLAGEGPGGPGRDEGGRGSG